MTNEDLQVLLTAMLESGEGESDCLFINGKPPLVRSPPTDLPWAGQQGIDMAWANLPELVLLDLDLPDLHGSKVLEEL